MLAALAPRRHSAGALEHQNKTSPHWPRQPAGFSLRDWPRSSAPAVQNCTAAAHEVVSCRAEAEDVRSYYPDPMCMSQLSITCPTSPGGAFLLAVPARSPFVQMCTARRFKRDYSTIARGFFTHPPRARFYLAPPANDGALCWLAALVLRRFASFG
jgi:hypothetical protein